MTVLAYHEITPIASSGYGVSVSQFNGQLESISRRQKERTGDLPLVTLDDGLDSQHRCALPLLEKHGVKAMFFVNAGLVGKTVSIKGSRQTFMDWTALKELVQLDHQVCSHGWSHKYLTTCSNDELQQEIERSRQTLEDRLGVKVKSLSFPGGRWNSRVLRRCRESGYNRVFTSDPWILAVQREGMTVQGRFMVRRSTDVAAFETILRPNVIQMLRWRIQGKFKSVARGLIGNNCYHAVWKRLVDCESNSHLP